MHIMIYDGATAAVAKLCEMDTDTPDRITFTLLAAADARRALYEMVGSIVLWSVDMGKTWGGAMIVRSIDYYCDQKLTSLETATREPEQTGLDLDPKPILNWKEILDADTD